MGGGAVPCSGWPARVALAYWKEPPVEALPNSQQPTQKKTQTRGSTMPCCGDQSSQFRAPKAKPPSAKPIVASPGVQAAQKGTVFFQYVGHSSLTAIGAATGRHYHFHAPGVRLAVNPSDLYSLRALSRLKQV
jgi:hypothetical protein